MISILITAPALIIQLIDSWTGVATASAVMVLIVGALIIGIVKIVRKKGGRKREALGEVIMTFLENIF